MVNRLVFLDRQHAGKPGSMDRGAWADINGDGSREHWEAEANLTNLYLHHAEVRLGELGYTVIKLSDGRYSDRHDRVNRESAVAGRLKWTSPYAYIAAHANAGGGDYGLVLHDHRSPPNNGPVLAQRIADRLGRAAPELSRVVTDGASLDRWDRAYNTIRGLKSRVVGICFEPFFLDFPEHARTLATPEGLERIGVALAEGIDDWYQNHPNRRGRSGREIA